MSHPHAVRVDKVPRIIVQVFYADPEKMDADSAVWYRFSQDVEIEEATIFFVPNVEALEPVYLTSYPIDTKLTNVNIAEKVFTRCWNDGQPWVDDKGKTQRPMRRGDVVAIHDQEEKEISWYRFLGDDEGWKRLKPNQEVLLSGHFYSHPAA